MQATYRHGKRITIDYTAGEDDILAGEVVVIDPGNLIGVATIPIEAGMLGALDIGGVFDVVCVAETSIGAADPVYWDATGNPFGGVAETGAATDSSEGTIYMGRLSADSEGSDPATVSVILNQPIQPA